MMTRKRLELLVEKAEVQAGVRGMEDRRHRVTDAEWDNFIRSRNAQLRRARAAT